MRPYVSTSEETIEPESKIFQTMLLLGAGASIPAGIPSIDKMTAEFLSNPLSSIGLGEQGNFLENEKAYRRKFQTLANLSEQHYHRADLEIMMSLILQLKDSSSRELFGSRYSLWDLFRVIKNNRAQQYSHDYNELLNDLKTKLEAFIRKKCEDIKSVDYFWPLQGLRKNTQLEIYTLNYDATIEMYCEKNDIPFTDGFDPYWHPENFAHNTGINLYKLHGSLYWLRTESNKYIKVPIKGLKVSDVKYLTDEKISEMMIYPMLQKNKEPMVYSWLSQKFKEQLNKFDTCIVIGYSFRDDDIRDAITESLSSNKKLWLVLVNPKASEHKRWKFSQDDEIASRIVIMNMGMEEALRERNLHWYLQKMETARESEERAFEAQQNYQDRMDNEYWNNILRNYREIKHHDRIRWIVEKLSKERFKGVLGSFPDSIEGIAGPLALKYALDYKNSKNKEKMDCWKDIFLGSCLAGEFQFFDHDKPNLRAHNPINESDLPSWYSSRGVGVGDFIHNLKDNIKKISIYDNKKLKNSIEKLYETLSLITYEKRLSRTSSQPISDEEIINGYKNKDLGIVKWARQIVEELK